MRVKTNFKKLTADLKPYLEQKGIPVNFSGYTETIRAYLNLNDTDIETIQKLMTETNLWSDFLAEYASFIELIYLQETLALDRRKAMFYYLETQKEDALLRRMNLYQKHLFAQANYFKKISQSCLFLYTKNMKKLGLSFY